MRVLITGAGGFVGRHLVAHLATQGQTDIWGTTVISPDQDPSLAKMPVQWVMLDLRDPHATAEVVAQIQPDRVYHLAAQAFVPASFDDPWDTLENNIRGQVNLFQALLKHQPSARVLVISSAHVYGSIQPADNPVSESQPFRPDSPYSVSKVAQDMLGLQYYLAHQLHTVRARPFNHIGPGQNTRFALPNFADQIAAAELGEHDPVILVGNLEAERDFTDVRDVVGAYYLMLERGEAGQAYNVCSGHIYSMQTLLQYLCQHSRIPLQIRTDPARFRPLDVPRVVGDCRKLHQDTGWKAVIDIHQSLTDILDYSRQLRTPLA